MQKQRVVVTGLGIISPLGIGVDNNWHKILAGKSGITHIKDFDTKDFTTKIAGLVPDFNVEQFMSVKEAKKVDLFIQYGIAAGVEAMQDAGLSDTSNIDVSRAGVIMGSGIGGIGTIEQSANVLATQGPRRISPFFIPASIVNMIAGYLSIRYGLQGLTLAPATACTTATHAIGLALRSISYGDADIIIAGGAEKASTPLGIAGFAAARALSTQNSEPTKASRPWDVNRDGFVLGDGAGALVLESYEHAKKRGARIYAELSGFGMSSDAFHITRPSGIGAQQAMRLALQDAKIGYNQIDYINAHGTSTPVGDLEESKAIAAVFAEHASKLMVSSTKSMTGHLLGAAGAVEAIYSVLALHHNAIPPTINLDEPDDKEISLDYVPHEARQAKITTALSNSFGFGGTNGTLVFNSL